MKSLLGKKLGMTTIYDGEGVAHNVTLIECAPNTVSLLRSEEKDGYAAVQLETALTKKKQAKKEFRVSEGDDVPSAGETVTVEVFSIGDKVNVSGVSKGKGFQGVVKRHGFKGGFATHGHRHDLRQSGSIGSMFPQKVFKGKRMAGRMGGERQTVKNLTVAMVDAQQNLLAVRGAVPGVIGRIVEVRGQ